MLLSHENRLFAPTVTKLFSPLKIHLHGRAMCMLQQMTLHAAEFECLSVSKSEFLALKHESRILENSSNPVYGFCMLEQVRLCCFAHGELAWLFLDPDTWLDDCPKILLSCFRARTSAVSQLSLPRGPFSLSPAQESPSREF